MTEIERKKYISPTVDVIYLNGNDVVLSSDLDMSSDWDDVKDSGKSKYAKLF